MHRVIEEIIESNNWRDGEFTKLKVSAAQTEDVLLLKMCIPIIYAHWEGYVISSLEVLLSYLNTLQLKSGVITERMIVVGMGDAYKSLSGKQTFDQRVKFTEKFKNLTENPLKFKTRIDTKSNLRSDVLEDICTMFSFRFENFSEYTRDINLLVNIRNIISHGENSVLPDAVMVEKFIKIVLGSTDILLKEIDYFLENEVFIAK